MAIGLSNFIAYDTSSWTKEELEYGISGHMWYDKVIAESIAHTKELCIERAVSAGYSPSNISVDRVTTILKGRMC